MSDALSILFGPLAGPECARASRRSWLIWLRMLLAAAAGSVAFVACWFWWLNQRIAGRTVYLPFFELRTALAAVEWLLVGFAMVMTPAILAGSLAGDKERGSIGLLLTTRVNSLEIVLGRLAGRLSQVAMIGLAACPILFLIAATAGFGWASTLALVALPSGVALGNAGIALAASATCRRGRDALLVVYLLDFLLMLGPAVESTVAGASLFNPFVTSPGLAWGEEVGPALATAGLWASMGLLGLALASWRLRPSSLAPSGGSKPGQKARRRGAVPPVDDDRPMLWKELHIERVGSLGKFGRWLGGLLVLGLGVGGLAFASAFAWGTWVEPGSGWSDWAVRQSSTWIGDSSTFVGYLLQWAIGLRAAVTIASERERGTWDALLTSPLEGGEIVRGKLWGSLHALRWLVASALFAWTATAAIGGMFPGEYAERLVELATVGTFMAAVGVRASLQAPTATKAMGVTVGLWLGTVLLAKAVAALTCLLVALACVLGWMTAVSMGLAPASSRPWFPMSFRLGVDLVFTSEIISLTLTVVAETRLRFDRIAGRIAGGETETKIDRMIHGRPMAPVHLDRPKTAPKPEMDGVAG